MNSSLTVDQLESAWMSLAEGITAVGEQNEAKFLAKLALLLVTPDRLAELPQLIAVAREDL